jgi:hypothetical protein
MKQTSRRALVERLLRKHELILTKAVSSHDRFAALKNLERAEKRFLLSFVFNIVAGTYILASELWNLTLAEVPGLPIPRLFVILVATAALVSGILAILGYVSIGLVIERAVEIKPRDERG